jgi:pyruvate dehydrogenase E2 component (dihydrolipoyllysine-residue acetyltransferase)
MTREFKLPDLGEGLTEAEIVRVLVAEGDVVREDQPILLVETEKAQVELPSPFEGRVARIHVAPGQRIKVGSVLLTFGDGAEGAPVAATSVASRGSTAPPARSPLSREASPPPRDAGSPGPGLLPAATPATRRLARELSVDLAVVKGTGPGGRITDADVRAAAGRPAAPAQAADAAPRPGPFAPEGEAPRPLARAIELPPLPRFEQWGPVTREPLRGIRRRSAEHLALAWSLIPHVIQHDQADITQLEALRRRHQELAETWGGNLTLTVLLVKAVALILARHPRFNASLDSETGELVLKRYYHIGVAVDTDRGLVVPVLRDVATKRLRELAVELPQLAARTREGKATLDDLRGGTFTVTNTGALGGTGATPIINYPEVAILGVARARELPVVRDGQVVVRLILPLSLAFDHRVIDGMEAARFSTDLVHLLENPERLLLEA